MPTRAIAKATSLVDSAADAVQTAIADYLPQGISAGTEDVCINVQGKCVSVIDAAASLLEAVPSGYSDTLASLAAASKAWRYFGFVSMSWVGVATACLSWILLACSLWRREYKLTLLAAVVGLLSLADVLALYLFVHEILSKVEGKIKHGAEFTYGLVVRDTKLTAIFSGIQSAIPLAALAYLYATRAVHKANSASASS